MKLIKLSEDHYIIMDDSEIVIGDIVAERLLTGKYDLFTIHTLNDIDKLTQKKIIYSTQPESLGVGWMQSVLPLLLSEVEELLGEVDVEKRFQDILNTETPQEMEVMLLEATKHGFKYGYNQALEDNKDKKYTEEDLKYMFECGRNYQNNAEITFKVSIDHLQSKTEWEVEIVGNKLKLKQ